MDTRIVLRAGTSNTEAFRKIYDVMKWASINKIHFAQTFPEIEYNDNKNIQALVFATETEDDSMLLRLTWE